MIGLTFLILAVVIVSCTPSKKIEKRSTLNLDSVSATVPVSKSAVAEVIKKLFQNKKYVPGRKFERFSLVPADDQLFPEDRQIQLASKNNSSLQHYMAIAPDLRKNDFYLFEPTGDYYWHSEYYYDNTPANFRCGFIIHIKPEGNANARIEIFEYLPAIWVGKKFGFGAHGPGYLQDIREVEPTTLDRVELLNAIKEVAKQFKIGKLPTIL